MTPDQALAISSQVFRRPQAENPVGFGRRDAETGLWTVKRADGSEVRQGVRLFQGVAPENQIIRSSDLPGQLLGLAHPESPAIVQTVSRPHPYQPVTRSPIGQIVEEINFSRQGFPSEIDGAFTFTTSRLINLPLDSISASLQVLFGFGGTPALTSSRGSVNLNYSGVPGGSHVFSGTVPPFVTETTDQADFSLGTLPAGQITLSVSISGSLAMNALNFPSSLNVYSTWTIVY